jgi:hypothetical protein
MQKTVFPMGVAAAIMIAPAVHASDAAKITFDGACNTLTLSAFHDSRSAILGGENCPQGLAAGFTGSFKTGKAVGLGVRFLGDPAGYYLVLSNPIVTGGTWTLSKSADGKTSTSTGGTYSVDGDPNARPQSSPSITDMRFGTSAQNHRTVTVSFDGYCNVLTITISKTGSSFLENDDCDVSIGEGAASKVGQLGKIYGFGWTSADARGAANDLVFTEPFTTGGSVSVYYTTNGISQNVTGPINYTVETGPIMPSRRGLKPISSLLK